MEKDSSKGIEFFNKVNALLKKNLNKPLCKDCLEIIDNEEVSIHYPLIQHREHLYDIYLTRFELQKEMFPNSVAAGLEECINEMKVFSQDKAATISVAATSHGYMLFTSIDITQLIGIVFIKDATISSEINFRKLYTEKGYSSPENLRFYKRKLVEGIA